MPRRGDNTGIAQTCPRIDSVRDFIEGIEWSEDEQDIAVDAKKACAELEVIRKMNSDLRDFGNKQYEELEEMEKARDYYKKLSEQQEKEIESLNEDIRELEKELSSVNNQ